LVSGRLANDTFPVQPAGVMLERANALVAVAATVVTLAVVAITSSRYALIHNRYLHTPALKFTVHEVA
jgi:hypothetical protein